MRRSRPLVGAGLGVACLGAACFGVACLIAVTYATTAAGARQEPRCPTSTQIDPGASGPERLLKAARVEIPKRFHITNQTGRVKIIPANYRITEIVALAPTFPDLRDAKSYRRAAVSRCGEVVAINSWAVVVHFSKAQTIPASWGALFFAPTDSGWRFWFRYH